MVFTMIFFMMAFDRKSGFEAQAPKLRSQVQGDPGLKHEVVPLEGLLPRLVRTRPDVLLLFTPKLASNDLEALLLALRTVSQGVKLLVTYKGEPPDALALVQGGASGCIDLSTSPALLARAVRCVHSGGHWFSREQLLLALQRQVRPDSNHRGRAVAFKLERQEAGALTHREQEIMALIGQGLSNKEIARRLCISPATVKTHLHHVYTKLQRSGRYKAYLAQPPNPSLPAPAIEQ